MLPGALNYVTCRYKIVLQCISITIQQYNNLAPPPYFLTFFPR